MPLNNFSIVRRVNGKPLYRSAQPDADGLTCIRAIGARSIIKLNDGPSEGQPLEVIAFPMPSWSNSGGHGLATAVSGESSTRLSRHIPAPFRMTRSRNRPGSTPLAGRGGRTWENCVGSN